MEQLAVCVAVFLGGIVSGFAGFAFSAVAGAGLVHFLAPMLAVPLMMSCTIVSQLTTLAALRRFIDWREAVPMIVGGVAGLPIGLGLLMLAQPAAYRIAFGVCLVGYALYMLIKRPSWSFASIAGSRLHSAVGFAGGLVGGFTAMPGALPVIWCGLRGVPAQRPRGGAVHPGNAGAGNGRPCRQFQRRRRRTLALYVAGPAGPGGGRLHRLPAVCQARSAAVSRSRSVAAGGIRPVDGGVRRAGGR